EDPGVLVLSRFAGAAEQLPEALLVNPYDREGTAAAILLALQMPLEERRSRHEEMMKTLRRYDVHWWCETFLAALGSARAEEKGPTWLRL
ncbi:MAG TPA: trehalose-6-phosphate synthase, partial [Ramlibacter sp.]